MKQIKVKKWLQHQLDWIIVGAMGMVKTVIRPYQRHISIGKLWNPCWSVKEELESTGVWMNSRILLPEHCKTWVTPRNKFPKLERKKRYTSLIANYLSLRPISSCLSLSLSHELTWKKEEYKSRNPLHILMKRDRLDVFQLHSMHRLFPTIYYLSLSAASHTYFFFFFSCIITERWRGKYH